MKSILFAAIFCLSCLMAASQQLKISSGTFLTNNNATITVLNTDIQNDGVIVGANGTFTFTGANNIIIAGNGTSNFHNIQLSKQAGSKTQKSKTFHD